MQKYTDNLGLLNTYTFTELWNFRKLPVHICIINSDRFWYIREMLVVSWLLVLCLLMITQLVSGFYCLNVKLCVNQAHRDEFIQCIKENALYTRKEPKCVSYTWGEDVQQQNTFRFQEIFKDESGFKEHTVLTYSFTYSFIH